MASLLSKCIRYIKCRGKDKPADPSDPPAQLSSSEAAWEGEVDRLEAMLVAMGAGEQKETPLAETQKEPTQPKEVPTSRVSGMGEAKGA